MGSEGPSGLLSATSDMRHPTSALPVRLRTLLLSQPDPAEISLARRSYRE